MPSQLITNDKISFVVIKPLKWYDHYYEPGDDFPQEAAKNIETLVRARYLQPVVDDINDKPRHWHREVRPRDEVMAKLQSETVQIVLPTVESAQGVEAIEAKPDESAGMVQAPGDLGNLEDETEITTAEEPMIPAEVDPEVAAEAVHSDIYDPSYHTVTEVNEYLAAHPDERDAVIEAEQAGRNRKGIVEGY